MERVVLITGGNRGPREELIERARQLIGERIGRVVAFSTPMESEAWGFRAEGAFLNQVVVAESDLEPLALLKRIQELERELGRDRELEMEEKRQTGEAYASRRMDIDLLYYGDRVIDLPELQVPHPRIAERSFVLRPLVEVLPDWVDPRHGKRVEELWGEWIDKNEEKR